MMGAIFTFIAFVLVVVWLILVLTAHILGGFVHLFLIGALVIVGYQLYKNHKRA